MTIGDREIQALTAYLNLMRAKGAEDARLEQRKQLLLPLLSQLAAQPLNSSAYRQRVDLLLGSCQKSDWPIFLTSAREYYPFWLNDFKAIAALNASGGFDVMPAMAPIAAESLETLWNNLDREQFSVTEKWPLKAYAAALREEGVVPAVIDTRIRMVKLLLLRLREVDIKDSPHYRVAVDATLPLFSMKESRDFFMLVVREFYYFWEGNPAAANYLVLGSKAR